MMAAKAGDEAAVVRLYRDLNPALVRFLGAQAIGAGEDLAQEVWLAAAKGLESFSGDEAGFRAWIFTPVLSRYRFVYPVFRETTETAIEACEAAWAFFHGVFRVLIPDNTKTIVQRADPLEPRLTAAFLEYAQARGFVIGAYAGL